MYAYACREGCTGRSTILPLATALGSLKEALRTYSMGYSVMMKISASTAPLTMPNTLSPRL